MNIFEKMWAKLKHIFQNEPQVEHVALIALAGLEPAVEGIALAIGGAEAGEEVQAVITKVQQDMTLAQSIIEGAAAPEGVTVSTILSDVSTNIGGILELAQVKNSAHAATITGLVNAFVGSINAIAAGLAPSQTQTAAS